MSFQQFIEQLRVEGYSEADIRDAVDIYMDILIGGITK